MLDTVVFHEIHADLIHHEMVLSVLDAIHDGRQDERVAVVVEILQRELLAGIIGYDVSGGIDISFDALEFLVDDLTLKKKLRLIVC